jgi:hypothetical protein
LLLAAAGVGDGAATLLLAAAAAGAAATLLLAAAGVGVGAATLPGVLLTVLLLGLLLRGVTGRSIESMLSKLSRVS